MKDLVTQDSWFEDQPFQENTNLKNISVRTGFQCPSCSRCSVKCLLGVIDGTKICGEARCEFCGRGVRGKKESKILKGLDEKLRFFGVEEAKAKFATHLMYVWSEGGDLTTIEGQLLLP